MTFNIFTAQRVSCTGQYDRIDDLIPCNLRGDKCRVFRDFLVYEFHSSAVVKGFDPRFVLHFRISSGEVGVCREYTSFRAADGECVANEGRKEKSAMQVLKRLVDERGGAPASSLRILRGQGLTVGADPPNQNSMRRAPWMTRAPPPTAPAVVPTAVATPLPTVAVILPKFPLLWFATGLAKFVWLKRLKKSTRKRRWTLSVTIGKLLATAKL